MTWKELKAHIEVMDEEQINTDVIIYLERADEFLPVKSIDFTDETNVLDKNHPFIKIEF